MSADSAAVFALSRPNRALWTYYVIRALLTGPGVIFLLPLYFFRFRTLRYAFDEEGIHMTVGVLFRREVNLTYARIQDIHLHSGVIQRWLGLADIQIQTASGASGAELTIEGFKEFEAIRDFLYTRMRGARATSATPTAPAIAGAENDGADIVQLLHEIRDELRQTRESLAARRVSPPPADT